MGRDLTAVLEPNAQFPQLSALVRVGSDARRGRFVEAVANIPPGTVVCHEKGIAVGIDPRVCSYCLVPLTSKSSHCPSCSSVHQKISIYEAPFRDELDNLGLTAPTVRVLLSHSVEDIRRCLAGDRSGENAFSPVMELKKGTTDVDFSVIADFLARFERSLKVHPDWLAAPEGLFRSAFKEVFNRLTINAHTVYSTAKTCSTKETLPCGVGLFPISSIFNHSCRSNVFSFFVNDTFVFVSRGVRKGEELVDSYGIQAHSADFQERKNFLNGRGFECICEVCVGKESNSAGDLHEEDMESYSDYDVFDRNALNEEPSEEAIDRFNRRRRSQVKKGITPEPEIINEFVMMSAQFAESKKHRSEVIDWLRCALLHTRFLYCSTHPAYEITRSFLETLKRSGEEDQREAKKFRDAVRRIYA